MTVNTPHNIRLCRMCGNRRIPTRHGLMLSHEPEGCPDDDMSLCRPAGVWPEYEPANTCRLGVMRCHSPALLFALQARNLLFLWKEHLPYKQGVAGSSPASPTTRSPGAVRPGLRALYSRGPSPRTAPCGHVHGALGRPRCKRTGPGQRGLPVPTADRRRSHRIAQTPITVLSDLGEYIITPSADI